MLLGLLFRLLISAVIYMFKRGPVTESENDQRRLFKIGIGVALGSLCLALFGFLPGIATLGLLAGLVLAGMGYFQVATRRS